MLDKTASLNESMNPDEIQKIKEEVRKVMGISDKSRDTNLN
jgi:hypothetical protein